MKADFRIGNLIGQGEVMEIKENVVRVKYTADKERTSLIRYEDIKPIPLSESVLLKCPQLHQTPSGFFFRNEFISIKLTTRGYCRISVANNPIKIYYLHELQNAYPWFANRQELEVKWS